MTPLAEHCDLKDHYLAFIELDRFGIQQQVGDERWVTCSLLARFCTVRQVVRPPAAGLRANGSSPTVGVPSQVQSTTFDSTGEQCSSGSFCRFSLSFCSRVREEEQLDKVGVLKGVKEVISQLAAVSAKLGAVLQYHQVNCTTVLPCCTGCIDGLLMFVDNICLVYRLAGTQL